ncbi:MAG TPA: cytochrome b/b6 domain-containing protein [Rhodanobacteraceae bacterium]|nr:cytochrome b/b6 domain-containing protein [Rhodanobacteraceae bacterium]
MPDSTRTLVWDLPTRLFHWLLAVLILLQYGTAEWHWLSMRWHVWFGYATLALILFRVIWGFAGSETSRFAGFVRGPQRVFAYARELLAGRESFNVGHNPLGGWSVLAMLFCVFVQTITGLFTSNRRHTEFGPWALHVPETWSQRLTEIHKLNQNLLLILIGLHIAVVLAYWTGKNENLIGPMLHGRKDLAPMASLRFASAMRALIVLAIAASIVCIVVAASSFI